MRNRIVVFLLLGLAIIQNFAFAQEFPERTNRLVNDFSSTLSKEEVYELNTVLEEHENSSSIEIAIVLMPTLDGYPIEDYAFQLGEKWGIGKGTTDNGALILVSVSEHKLWIATGYGLEGSLPDGLIHRIVKDDIVPQFKAGSYFEGLKAGSEAIMLATKGEYEGQKKVNPEKTFGLLGIILLVFLVIWIVKAMQVKQYATMNHLTFWAAWALLNSASSKHSGSWSDFSGGRGHFGGGGFSGGGGGGGFGGFGGGSFGGGGAGGSW
jgi:uncharacterized protein